MTGREYNSKPSGPSTPASGEVVSFGHLGFLPEDTWDQLDQIPDAALRASVSLCASEFVRKHDDPTCKQLVRQLHKGVDGVSGFPLDDAPATKWAINTVLAAAERYSEPEQGQAAIQQAAEDIMTYYERLKLPEPTRQEQTGWLGGLMARFKR